MVDELFIGEFDKVVAAIALNEPTIELKGLLEQCQLYFCGSELIINCCNVPIFRRLMSINYEILRLFRRTDLIKSFCLQCHNGNFAFRCETAINPDFYKLIKKEKLIKFANS